ncbi:GNAT family N-acetyltransferase [Paenalkalicoccus suaedae]|uniref:GNAT family N-acetyltransferase n=1 Tax=Paenalkalicoccus suaedae TaxID=2592382 RepID=A0A859FD67_9BACI|nr:GNAT family N-acetyltransferase [Paenalkalicoccus suaedae]QKS70524.1 GNAT family N-acetyltransferase [Paenalkalicoccus suaedae]
MKLHYTSKSSLDSADLMAIYSLLEQCEKKDKAELELLFNLPMLENRTGEHTFDFLCYDKKRLVGYLAAFDIIDDKHLEVTAVVHPRYRKNRIFSGLLKQAQHEFDRKGVKEILIVIPTNSKAGRKIVAAMEINLSHSEFTLEHDKRSFLSEKTPFTLTPLEHEDLPIISPIVADAFSDPLDESEQFLAKTIDSKPYHPFKVIDASGEIIGTITVYLDGRQGFISGFVVDRRLQGQGLGKKILRQTVGMLQADNIYDILLDVEVTNANALRLYEECGFRSIAGYDYYKYR